MSWTGESIDEAELARLRELPWLPWLDAGDAAQLVAEYEAALRDAYRTGDRRGMERVLDFWRARAEASRTSGSTESDEGQQLS